MENVLVKENKMSVSSIIMDSQKILATSQQDLNKVLQRVCSVIKGLDETVNGVVEEQNKQKASIDKLEKNTNVICSPFHSKRRSNFNKLCKARVWHLFNDSNESPEYILFSHFLFKKIYSDVAAYFELDSWHDISMKDYEKEYSMYSQAKEFVTYWKPSDLYIRECIESMVNKRDNGLLYKQSNHYTEKIMCRLNDYLASRINNHNNTWQWDFSYDDSGVTASLLRFECMYGNIIPDSIINIHQNSRIFAKVHGLRIHRFDLNKTIYKSINQYVKRVNNYTDEVNLRVEKMRRSLNYFTHKKDFKLILLPDTIKNYECLPMKYIHLCKEYKDQTEYCTELYFIDELIKYLNFFGDKENGLYLRLPKTLKLALGGTMNCSTGSNDIIFYLQRLGFRNVSIWEGLDG